MDIFQNNIFYKTLIAEDSYLIVLKGLSITVEITLLALLFGTILGGIICVGRVSKNIWLRKAAAIYIALLRGSPVLLLLMLMYYVVFAKSSLSAPLISVSAFALNVSAHTAECFRAAFQATDAMQAEAARTLGFSKWQAFTQVTLPQTLKIAKPTYQSIVVNLIQWTSVVGYVTITDLTKVINNIGSRTMQPLFMLLVGIILYLLLAYLSYGFFALFDWISKKRAERRQV